MMEKMLSHIAPSVLFYTHISIKSIVSYKNTLVVFPVVSVQLLGQESENYDYRLSYQAYAAKGDLIY